MAAHVLRECRAGTRGPPRKAGRRTEQGVRKNVQQQLRVRRCVDVAKACVRHAASSARVWLVCSRTRAGALTSLQALQHLVDVGEVAVVREAQPPRRVGVKRLRLRARRASRLRWRAPRSDRAPPRAAERRLHAPARGACQGRGAGGSTVGPNPPSGSACGRCPCAPSARTCAPAGTRQPPVRWPCAGEARRRVCTSSCPPHLRAAPAVSARARGRTAAPCVRRAARGAARGRGGRRRTLATVLQDGQTVEQNLVAVLTLIAEQRGDDSAHGVGAAAARGRLG